ncbi:MAG: helix-turn-helix transcriptional regulator [Bdellovibrionota bacterium]
MASPKKEQKIAAYVRKARESLDISQGHLASLTGYSGPEAISRIETGLVAFPLEKAHLFADALGLDRREFWLFCMESSDVEQPKSFGVLAKDGLVPPDIANKLLKIRRSERFWEKVRELVKDDDERRELEERLKKFKKPAA